MRLPCMSWPKRPKPCHAYQGISIAMLKSIRQNTIWNAVIVSDIRRTDVCVRENRNIAMTAMTSPVTTEGDFDSAARPLLKSIFKIPS